MQQNLKVLMLNGSPRANGNTSVALKEMEQVFKDNGIETEIILVGNKDIRGCIACGSCYEKGKCVFNDMVNELALKFEEADGLVVASPVYYASANATLIACLDRLFYSSHFDKTMKVGASVVCARRGGCSATFDELNKYLQSPECRLHQASIGTAFMDVCRVSQSRTEKENRRCVHLQEI